MDLEICLTLEEVQSAEAEDRFTRASSIIARMILKIRTLEEPPRNQFETIKHQKVKNDQP